MARKERSGTPTPESAGNISSKGACGGRTLLDSQCFRARDKGPAQVLATAIDRAVTDRKKTMQKDKACSICFFGTWPLPFQCSRNRELP